MNKIENNLQTAFILAIVAVSILMLYAIFPSFFSFGGDTLTRSIMVFMVFPAPLVMGIISLSMCKVTTLQGVGTKYKVYRVIARVLSILAVIIGAILTFVFGIRFCLGY